MKQNLDSLAWVITALYSVVSVVFIVPGYLLWMGKVPPNSVTGFRTAKTLADPNLWYRVNSQMGREFVFLGVVILVTTLGLHFWITRERPLVTVVIIMAIILAGTTYSLISGFSEINK